MVLSIKNAPEKFNGNPVIRVIPTFPIHVNISRQLSTFIMRFRSIHNVGKAVKFFSSRNSIAAIGIKLRRRRNNRVGSKSRNHSRQSKNKKALHKFFTLFPIKKAPRFKARMLYKIQKFLRYNLQTNFHLFAHGHDLSLGLFDGVAASEENTQTAMAFEFRLTEQTK